MGGNGTFCCHLKIEHCYCLELCCLELCLRPVWGGGGVEGTPLYKLYRYVPPHQVDRFGLKTGIDFVHSGLESGLVFEGTPGVYQRV